MVTDSQISDFFEKNIKMLEKIALGISYVNNRNIDPYATISECYLYIYSIKNKIELKNLQQYSIQWIKNMLGPWSNNPLNNNEGNKKIDIQYIAERADEYDIDLESKIDLENWYNNRKCVLEMYKKQETNKVRLIILDCYFNKNITKGRDLAKHLKINKDYANRYIREMKASIREFDEKMKLKK